MLIALVFGFSQNRDKIPAAMHDPPRAPSLAYETWESTLWTRLAFPRRFLCEQIELAAKILEN
jgi:hypothetical protein